MLFAAGRPSGTEARLALYPALKRWAKIGRPSGAGIQEDVRAKIRETFGRRFRKMSGAGIREMSEAGIQERWAGMARRVQLVFRARIRTSMEYP